MDRADEPDGASQSVLPDEHVGEHGARGRPALRIGGREAKGRERRPRHLHPDNLTVGERDAAVHQRKECCRHFTPRILHAHSRRLGVRRAYRGAPQQRRRHRKRQHRRERECRAVAAASPRAANRPDLRQQPRFDRRRRPFPRIVFGERAKRGAVSAGSRCSGSCMVTPCIFPAAGAIAASLAVSNVLARCSRDLTVPTGQRTMPAAAA